MGASYIILALAIAYLIPSDSNALICKACMGEDMEACGNMICDGGVCATFSIKNGRERLKYRECRSRNNETADGTCKTIMDKGMAGVEACYCNSSDYCNSVQNIHGWTPAIFMIWFGLIFILITFIVHR